MRPFLGIERDRPHRFVAAADVEEALRTPLPWIQGRELESVWLMWELEADEWWSDGPMNLGIGGRQLELCFRKSDELFISIDAIDRDTSLK